METQKVYLAGGFKTNWQNLVKQSVNGLTIYDPREKEVSKGGNPLLNMTLSDSDVLDLLDKTPSAPQNPPMSLEEYAQWDLHFIRKSDIVFVYVERDNPGCIGLSVEAGYAKGLGKMVILVLEKEHQIIKDRYLQFITQVADIVFDNLKDGINYLKLFCE